MPETTDIRKAFADLIRQFADGVERLPMPTMGADPLELVPVVSRPDREAARAGKFPACVVSRKLMARRGDLLAWQASRTAVKAAPVATDDEFERFAAGGR